MADPTEQELRESIKQALSNNDVEAAKALLTQLIEIQELVPVTQLTNEQLAGYGVDVLLLEKERDLREKIKEANQIGDYVEALGLTKELLQVQRLQPQYTGIKLRE